jgi:hypothetical protein
MLVIVFQLLKLVGTLLFLGRFLGSLFHDMLHFYLVDVSGLPTIGSSSARGWGICVTKIRIHRPGHPNPSKIRIHRPWRPRTLKDSY